MREPFHDGAPAPTAVALMRARYSAYALGRLNYAFATWHPRTRPADLSSAGIAWTGLEILAIVDGAVADDAGEVTFRAHYVSAGEPGVMEERSAFVKRGGRWVYVEALA